MNVVKTPLVDCFVIEPKVFGDERGFFLETFQSKRYAQLLNIREEFVQDNHSRSSFGVLRGLHFQVKKPQGKLVRVVRGEVFDVAVDLRSDSVTYGKSFGVILNEHNKKQLWIPPGFAHGFVVLSETADFEYKCTDFYDPTDEGSIAWDDPDLGIEWPINQAEIKLSAKDMKAASFKQYSEGL
jgi:dTDP-4-dehydrorhamnose 3,5-epimerase